MSSRQVEDDDATFESLHASAICCPWKALSLQRAAALTVGGTRNTVHGPGIVTAPRKAREYGRRALRSRT